VKYIYPDGHPEWLRIKEFDGGPTGSPVRTAVTNNLSVRANVFSDPDLGLRFSTLFRFSGGEDVDFSRRAALGGARVLWVREAAVTEHQQGDRLNAYWLLERTERDAAIILTILAQQRGKGAAWRRALVRCPRLVLQAGLKTAALPFAIIAGRQPSDVLHQAKAKLYRARGYARAIARFMPEPYAQIKDRQ
jgi:GT2 family glycosyltransferase